MEHAPVSRRQVLERMGWLAAAAPLAAAAAPEGKPPAGGTALNVRDFGAVGDGAAKDTAALQRAIAAATAAGGGTVFVPDGRYLCGTVNLLDNVTLHLAEGALILGSTDIADYAPPSPDSAAHKTQALIHADRAHRVGLTGRGTVNGQGGKFTVKDAAPGRPHAVFFEGCQDVLIADVRVEDSASWVVHLLACERVVVRGIRVWSHANYNNDGIDIDACSDVTVSQCHFDCQDDAICLKSTPDRICENITVSDCFASSHCNLIKFGTSSTGGFRNVTIANCTLVAPRHSKMLNGAARGIGGISLELVDGGTMDRIAISNIVMDGITLPLFIRLGDRGRKKGKPAGTLRNVSISHIVATGMGPMGSSIAGLPDHCIENVSLSHLQFVYEGGGTAADAAREIPEKADSYPEGWMFGTLPAWGLYCRHVRGLKLDHVTLQLSAPDARHAVVFDDVEDLDVDALDCAFSPGAAPMVKMTATRDATIRGCRPRAPRGTFLQLEGAANAGIALLANDLRGAGRWLDAAPGPSTDAVAQAGNLLPPA